MSSDQLSLEEIRLLNIARNNDFLRNLFGPSEQTNTVAVIPAMQSICESPTTVKAKRFKVASDSIRGKEHLKKEILHRNNEIDELFGFVNQNLRSSPSLLVYGGSGCGKSAVCSAVLRELKVPTTIFQCSGFRSSREFFAALWDKLCDNTKQWRYEFERQYKSIIRLHAKDVRSPSKFAEFTVALGKLIYNLFESGGQPTSSQHQCYYLVFDGAEHLSSFDSTLAENLAKLSKLSTERIKVIMITERPLRLSQPQLAVSFAPYQEKQLVGILNKLTQQRLRQHREQVNDEEWLQAVTGNTQTDEQEQENSIYEEIRAQLLTERVSNALFANYNGVISIALSGFLGTSAHPIELLEATLSCWSVLYGNTMDEILSAVACEVLLYF